MKNIWIAASIVGVVVAGVIIYMREYYGNNELEDAAERVGDAANDALDTMDKGFRKVERKMDPVLN
jgi:hypothetical protein